MFKHIGWQLTISLLLANSFLSLGQNCIVDGLNAEVYFHPSRSVLAADLEWQEVIGADLYQVSYYSINSGEVVLDPTSNNYLTILDLFDNENYDWRVRAMCNDEWSGWENWDGFFSTDTTPPVVQAVDAVLSLNPNGVADILPEDIDDGSWDSSGTLTLTTFPEQLFCHHVGNNTVILIGTDAAGNQSTASATITVVDDTPPSLNTTEIIHELDLDGVAYSDDIDLYDYVFDNCEIDAISIEYQEYNCEDIGENLLNVTVTDVNGNSVSETITVNLIDPYAPQVDLENLTVQLDDNGIASIGIEDFAGDLSDNCSIESIEFDISSFSCDDIGENTVSVAVTDIAGNVTSGAVVVTVQDVTPPSLLVEPYILDLWFNGLATLAVEDLTSSITDNCGIAGASLSQTEFNCDDIGENEVTLNATDLNGNESNLIFTVTVQDTSPPTISVETYSLELSDGSVLLSVEDLTSVIEDNCGIAGTSLSQSEFGCDDIGENEVTLYATDENGNENSEVFTVIVSDITPPNLVVQDASIFLDENGLATLTENDVVVENLDGCGEATFFILHESYSCEDIGTSLQLVASSDENGNSVFDFIFVTVFDGLGPVLQLNDISISLDENGSASISFADIDNGTYDNCHLSSTSLSQSTFDCSDLGENVITVTAFDSEDNSSTADVTITVSDYEPPTVSLADISIQLDPAGSASINFEDLDNGSFDNCTIESTHLDIVDFSCEDVGDNTVTVTVIDDSGNVSIGTATVTVNDITPPIFEVQDIEIFVDENGQALMTEDFIIEMDDTCGDVSFFVLNEVYDCDDLGPNLNLVAASDVNNVVVFDYIMVTVTDALSPIVLVNDISISLDGNGEASLGFEDIDNGSEDNCSIETIELSQSEFNCDNLGENLVDVTLTDISGNSSTATITVTIEDNSAPTLIADEMIIELDDTGNGEISSSNLAALVDDNCGIELLEVDISSFDCTDIGTVEVSVSAIDGSDNIMTESVTVAVLDITPPSLSISEVHLELDESGNTALILSEHDPELGDNCQIESINMSQSVFNCDDLGVQTIDVSLTDPSGNITEAKIDVTVSDFVAPIALVNNIELELDDTGYASLTFEDLDNGSSDNCGIVYTTLSLSEFTCEDLGENVVTIELTDGQGNTTIEQVTVTVVNTNNEVAVHVSLNELEQSEDNFYQVNFTVESICGLNENPNVVISVPEIDQISNINFVPTGSPERFSISLGDITIIVFGSDVASLFQMIIDNRGIPVQNGQIIIIENIDSPVYEFHFEGGELYYASGPLIELFLKVTDPEGNVLVQTDEISSAIANIISSADELESPIEPLIYPVPTMTEFNVQLPESISSNTVNISLYNILGRQIETMHIGASQLNSERTFQIGSAELDAGYYVVRISGENFDISRKVLKTK